MPSLLFVLHLNRVFARRQQVGLAAALMGISTCFCSGPGPVQLGAQTIGPTGAEASRVTSVAGSDSASDDARSAFFESEIRPLLHNRCQKCHNETKRESGLSLASRDSMLSGGDSGPAVKLDQPGQSLMLRAVRHEDGLQMPPDEALTPHEIDALTRWIAMDAPWSQSTESTKVGPQIRSGPPTDEERQHWAFQPIRDPQVPTIASDWVRNDIDRFILTRLHEAELQPRRAADRSVWLRRATFDLTGLPPTLAEVADYVRDLAPDASEKVIDRLLSSTGYGERWGRHWLDVVRYADTAGETGDYPTPQSYKYRNWIIAAFNRDLPYDEFIRQQIAGDLLGAQLVAENKNADTLRQRQEMLIATGFIAISRRFGFDVENYHYLTIQDTIDTLGQTVLGLSLGCARCHDHKFDPISSADFYAWYGIFASTRYSFPGSEEKKRPYDLFSVAMNDGAVEPLSTERAAHEDGIYGAIEGDVPANVKVQLRGDPTKLGDEVPRRNLAILGGQPLAATRGSGRMELADWLTRPENPLTARVIANRVWQQHFGRGLVATENDFGVRGQLPSHPELLDWLASRLVESGWSLKSLHRLIMNSATYQQAGTFDAQAAEVDADDRLLWRFAPRRLSAEELRDAMLAVSGQLDRTQGQAHPFPTVDTWGFTQHAPFYAEYTSKQRSIYLMQQRLKRHPFLALFDGADPNSTTGHRELTTVPTQSLFLMNSPFVHECSQQLADFVCTAALPGQQGAATLASISTDSGPLEVDPAGISAKLDTLYGKIHARLPNGDERLEAVKFLEIYMRELAELEPAVASAEHDRVAWAALARTLLIQNEFLFVD